MRITVTLKYAGAAVLLAAGACSDGADTTAPDFAPAATTGLACSFSDMQKDADKYFSANGSIRTDAGALIASMRSQFGPRGNAATTALGFDLLALVADQHRAINATDGTQPAGTPADGSRLANDVIGCMTTIDPRPTAPIDFARPYQDTDDVTQYRGALSKLGAFEVRGGANAAGDLVAMVSANRKASIVPPAAGFDAWLPAANPRLLFYASPISNSFIIGDAAVGTVGYRWLTVPDVHVFAANVFATAGVCVNATDRDRLQEVNGTGTSATAKVLALTTLTMSQLGLDCSSSAVLGSATQSGLFRRAMDFATKMILPTPAYAGKLGGGTGGLLGGLSDIGVSDVGLAGLTMSFVQDSRTTKPVTLTVTMKTAGGNVMPGETVAITVSGNSGSFTPINVSGPTDKDGKASFSFILDKPGGYTVSASSDYGNDATDGTPLPATVISNLFHIKQ